MALRTPGGATKGALFGIFSLQASAAGGGFTIGARFRYLTAGTVSTANTILTVSASPTASTRGSLQATSSNRCRWVSTGGTNTTPTTSTTGAVGAWQRVMVALRFTGTSA